jgi:hypothetical protein
MIPGFSTSWLQAMIERSSPLPMRINIRISLDPVTMVKSLAASALLSASRIRTLNISACPTDVLTILNRLCSPSPLGSLSLSVLDVSRHIDLPSALFDRNAPHLHHLSLESYACIRAPFWLLTGITHFTIFGGFSPHELLNTLKAMTQLEILHVAYTLHDPLAVPVNEEVLSHVVLPHLSQLSIRESNLRRFIAISSHIDAPPTLRKHLHMMLRSPWEHYINIFPSVQALFPHESAPGVEDGGLWVAKVTGGPTSGSLDVWSRTFSESANANAAAFAREDALFLFRIEWTRLCYSVHNEPRCFFRLAKFCSHLCTAHIEDFTAVPEAYRILQDVPDAVAQWQALLAALPAVKTLPLHRGSTTCVSLLRALSASASLLPLLQKVFVVYSTVRYAAASADGCDGGGVSSADASFAMASPDSVKINLGAELVDVLSGRPGLEVVLIKCEVDEEALEALRERAWVEIGDECVYTQAFK